MELPDLLPKKRDREYNMYSKQLRARVIFMYLFKGKSHRWIDEMILMKNPDISKGYQSMGILHHVGLLNTHKNMFKDFSIEQAKKYVEGKSVVYSSLLVTLETDMNNESNDEFVYEIKENQFQEKIDQKISEVSVEYLTDYLENYLPQPPKQKVENAEGSFSYPRSIYEATKALINAQFQCEISDNHCSFISKKTGKNYVEAHHVIPISFQWKFQYDIDRVPNLVALCPNCHKKIHLSINSEKESLLKELYNKRRNDLNKIGVVLSEKELLEMYDV